MDNDRHNNFALTTAFLMSLSLSIPLIVIDAPFWVISAASLIVFMPYIIPSTITLFIVNALYALLLKPGLYIWAVIVAMNGPQDFIAIAFYVVAGLQVFNIIKNFIYYLFALFAAKK